MDLATRSFLELVLAESATKIVTESCIAIKTIYGWAACCDDPKHLWRVLGKELHEVDRHLLAEDPGIEEGVRRRIGSARSVEELFVALVSYPRIALAIGTILPLYLPPQRIAIRVGDLDGHAAARANPLRLEVEVDPVVACRDGDVEELGRVFTEVALHEYLHLALHANMCSGSGVWLLGKPIGMERTVVEIVDRLVDTVPPSIVEAVGRKLCELIPIDRCRDRGDNAHYTDLACAVIVKNTSLVEKLRI